MNKEKEWSEKLANSTTHKKCRLSCCGNQDTDKEEEWETTEKEDLEVDQAIEESNL